MTSVIFCLDLGDPELLKKWADEDKLPHLKRMISNGVYGKIGGSELICEHGIWVSLFSGISRREHNYYYFRRFVPQEYGLEPFSALDVPAEPFWARLGGTGKRVAVIDIPDSKPVDNLQGIQLLDWTTHYPLLPAAFRPKELETKVRRIFGPRKLIHEELNSNPQKDGRILQRLLKRVKKKGELCYQLLKDSQWDMVLISFSEGHTAGHQFWPYFTDENGGRNVCDASLQNAICEVYRAIDAEFGRLHQQLFPAANVFLLSSTGIESRYPTTELMENFCRKFGYQAIPGGNASKGRPLQVARQALPESMRTRLSCLLPRYVQDRLLSDKFRNSIDWSATTAFSIPSYYTGFIRVNLRGREPKGIVAAGSEYDDLLDKITDDLYSLVEPVSCKPAVKQIARTVNLFGGDAPLYLPDLFVTWQPLPYLMTSVSGKGKTITQSSPAFYRGSDHTQEGFWAAAGPAVKRVGDVGETELLDFCPSFLSLLSQSLPSTLHGKPLTFIDYDRDKSHT